MGDEPRSIPPPPKSKEVGFATSLGQGVGVLDTRVSLRMRSGPGITVAYLGDAVGLTLDFNTLPLGVPGTGAPFETAVYDPANGMTFRVPAITGVVVPYHQHSEAEVIGLVPDLAKKLEDSAHDGGIYGRRNGTWTSVGGAVQWTDISGKPDTFPPTLPIPQSGVTGLTDALAARPTEAATDGTPYARRNAAWVATILASTYTADKSAQDTRDTGQDTAITTLQSTHAADKSAQATRDTGQDSAITALQTGKEDKANKSVPGGYPMLDGSGLVPSTQLPSYVDDVVEYANLAAFPATGTTGLIYVALNTNKIYRWSGSAYIEISPSPGSTDSVPEGSVNLYFTTARALASAPVQEPASGFNLRTPGSWVAGVRLSGDTMTGALTLSGDPTADLQAAPRQYVDKRAGTGMSFFDYMFNGSQYVAPPNSGNVRMNNANQTLATKIWLHDITYVNNDASNILDLIGVGDKFYIQDKDNSSQWQRYLITAIADMGAYHEFSVTWEAGGSALVNQRIGIFTLRASSSGSGAATAIGDTPPASPVAGQLWWNSTSGELYIRYADADSSQWVVAVLPPVSVPEAATDGKIYARQNGAWVSPRAARVTRATVQSIVSGTPTFVTWSAATFDVGGFWNAGAPTRLTIPAGVSLVRVTGQTDWAINATGERYSSINRNAGAASAADRRVPISFAEANFSTGPVQVAAGDYFELGAYQNSGGALNFNNSFAAWFSIEVLG